MVFNVATSTIANGENASNVLGQPNFTSSTATTTQSGLGDPTGLAYDPESSRLFVGDYTNYRVMVFNVATSTITNGENAMNVLGQTNFTSSTSSVTQSGFNTADQGLAYDPTTGNLFVGDTDPNNRVMVFNAAPSTITNGENAYALLGHVDQSGNPLWTVAGADNGPNAQGFSNQGFPVLDTLNHRLFVGDGNNRILVFPLDANNNPTHSCPN